MPGTDLHRTNSKWSSQLWLRQSGWRPLAARRTAMVVRYMVGTRTAGKSASVTVEAEDALMAALKVKHENPAAVIAFVRNHNEWGDCRNPYRSVAEKPG
jgi:hypothetical protein